MWRFIVSLLLLRQSSLVVDGAPTKQLAGGLVASSGLQGYSSQVAGLKAGGGGSVSTHRGSVRGEASTNGFWFHSYAQSDCSGSPYLYTWTSSALCQNGTKVSCSSDGEIVTFTDYETTSCTGSTSTIQVEAGYCLTGGPDDNPYKAYCSGPSSSETYPADVQYTDDSCSSSIELVEMYPFGCAEHSSSSSMKFSVCNATTVIWNDYGTSNCSGTPTQNEGPLNTCFTQSGTYPSFEFASCDGNSLVDGLSTTSPAQAPSSPAPTTTPSTFGFWFHSYAQSGCSGSPYLYTWTSSALCQDGTKVSCSADGETVTFTVYETTSCTGSTSTIQEAAGTCITGGPDDNPYKAYCYGPSSSDTYPGDVQYTDANCSSTIELVEMYPFGCSETSTTSSREIAYCSAQAAVLYEYGTTNCTGTSSETEVAVDTCYTQNGTYKSFSFLCDAKSLVEGLSTAAPTRAPSATPTRAPSATPTRAPTSTATTQAPTSTAAPSPSSSSASSCFAGSELIELEGGTSIAISEIKVGDRIATLTKDSVIEYSDVVFIPHARNNITASFVEAVTEEGKSLLATASHLILTAECATGLGLGLMQAKRLVSGQCVLTKSGAERIARVSYKTSNGLYTVVPLNRGYILVNELVASPFAISHEVGNMWYDMHRAVYKAFPSLMAGEWLMVAQDNFVSPLVNLFADLIKL